MKRRRKIIIFSVLVLIAGAVTFFALRRETENVAENVFEYEENITVGELPGVDREAMLAALQANTDKAAVAFSINSKPVVTGTEMNLLFENPMGNGKDIILSIYENETNEIIYKSKAIREGNYLATVTLLKEYEPGSYEATALITALNTETHDVIGETAAGITLRVEGR